MRVVGAMLEPETLAVLRPQDEEEGLSPGHWALGAD